MIRISLCDLSQEIKSPELTLTMSANQAVRKEYVAESSMSKSSKKVRKIIQR
ncbi:MAG: hypothetical protein MUD09_08855 [Desulfobacterales bacterium]|nr:hypothetical protein [Desulfobacterales bacterium]